MFKFSYKKAISVVCSLLIIISSFVSAFTLANADAGVIIQDFENHPGLKSVKYFTIYNATSANDANVYEGTKSLKWTTGTGTDAVSFWQSGMDLIAGQLYKMEMQIKLTAANKNSLVLKHLTTRDNGWANNGTSVTINTSNFPVGEWYNFTTLITAEQRAIGMYIYGEADIYFDYIKFTPVTTKNVTVTVNTGTDQTVESLKGEAGSKMTLPTLTKDGYYFAGWYSDVEFKIPFTETETFPAENIEIYAKWLPGGVLIQDFEKNYTYSGNGFTLYTATDENDTNVKDGTKSLKWTHLSGSKAISLYPNKDLTVGETYKLEMWVKAVSSTASHIDITQLDDVKNGWAFGQNTRIALPHFGTDYDSVGEWKRFEYTFVAEKKAMGILLYGEDDFYFDSITWTPVKQDITVTIVSNNGEEYEALKGAAGMELKLPTLTKEGYYFAGWFENAKFTKPLNSNLFPEENTTVYARWIENGIVTQNFESYDHKLASDSGFTLYTATDENDTNVSEGERSLFRQSVNKTRVAAISDQYATLTVGKAYKLTFKLKVVESGTGGDLQFTDLSVRSNPWSYSKLISMHYVGTDYKYINEWNEITYIFIAESSYFGIASWGDISYYVDDFKVVEIPITTVSFVTGDGEEKAPQSGAAGSKLTVENPVAPKGKTFAGWYLDESFTEPYVISTYPETDVTLYARWITAGTFEQDFELWPGDGAFGTSPVFTLYTATDENDPNVYSGKHSMLYSNEDKGNTFALNIFDTTMGKLQIGEKYNVSIRFKPVSTSLGEYDQGGTYHSIYNTTLQSNCWAYQSQGPQGRYRSYVFYHTEFSDEYWTGTGNAVTTTTEKDENGWLTMNYEITATTPYIALYMTGYYSMYIDYITVIPLESGVVGKDYSLPYTEEFYNLFYDNGIFEAPNKTGKNIYKLDVLPCSDYVFTASLAKGLYGDPKVYLAWDENGENKIEGTEFVGNTPENKLYSSRIITSFDTAVYLVVEGGGLGSSDYFAFFPTKYGFEEDPNPYYVRPAVDYNKLPSKLAAESTDIAEEITDDNLSPSTGDSIPFMPILLLFITCLFAAVLTLRKRGNCNE